MREQGNTEWLSRSELLIGSEGLEKLRRSNVLVVGLGGVGSYAAEMICRAGTGRMMIVDGDTVHPTNRNRQLPALRSTEGAAKAEVMSRRLLDINPELELSVVGEYIKDGKITSILDTPFDYIVDAIDTLSPKVFLLYESYIRNYRIVSSMGCGGKFDPLNIRICDISETTDCSLARSIRKRLHRLDVHKGITAVWSPETIDKSRVLSSAGEPNKASMVGTISYMPAAFGIACASVVIRDIAGIGRSLPESI
ncbi:MAG: tRNA threonylcarbamoyladenosine dehydratase [Bacteroidales bacterium]